MKAEVVLMTSLRKFALVYCSAALPIAIVFHELGHKDAGVFVLIGAIVIGIIAVPFPGPLTAPALELSSPASQETIHRTESHHFQHVIHHNLNYNVSTVVDAHETSRELPDGSVVRQRHVRQWR